MNGISFVIPVFNSPTLSTNCVKSIINLNDLKNINHEIIIVDDFSHNTLFLNLEKNLQNLNLKNISIYKNDQNMGPAYTRNKGVKHSKYDYIFFLDSDTEIIDGSINNFLEKIKTYDAVVGIYNYEPLSKGYMSYHKAYLNYYYSYKKDDYYFTNFAAACAGIKKNVFNTLNGFNDKIKWGMDYECEEFGYRLINNNYKLIVSSKTSIKHHFPTGLRGIQLYFIRVSNWVNFYLNMKKKFDKTAATTPYVAFGCISAFFSSLSAIFLFFFNQQFLFFLSFFFIFFYIVVFFNFFIFIFKKNKRKFFGIFMLNFIISNIITLSSFIGFLKFFKKKLIY
jgi:glycosyltransferase involved in cell wall biosynthesis